MDTGPSNAQRMIRHDSTLTCHKAVESRVGTFIPILEGTKECSYSSEVCCAPCEPLIKPKRKSHDCDGDVSAKWSWRRKVLKNLKVVHIQNLLYWNMWITLMKLKTSRITRKPLGGLDFPCWGACRWKLSAAFLLSSMVFFFALSSSWGYIPRLNPHIICLTCNINLVRYFSKQGAENAKKLSEYSGKANRAYYFTFPVS